MSKKMQSYEVIAFHFSYHQLTMAVVNVLPNLLTFFPQAVYSFLNRANSERSIALLHLKSKDGEQ